MNDEDIKLLKSIVKVHNIFLKGCKKETITAREIQAIENLLKENEELKIKIQFINKNNLDDLYEKALEKTMTKFLNDNIEKDFIPVAKIKEKIEEVNEEFSRVNTPDNNEWYIDSEIYAYAEEKLKELLEGK